VYDIEDHWFSRLDALMFPGHNYIGSEHLLLGLLREGEGVAARVLESLGADPSNIRTQVIRMIGETTEAVGAGVGGGSSGNKMPTLEEYGTNLTKLAEEVMFLSYCNIVALVHA
jgi:ATP-dependent Clp protease ATP-binding subunit ClpC